MPAGPLPLATFPQDAMLSIALPPAAQPAEDRAPASFVHPRATRQISLGGAHVAYELTRGQRRTVGFVVGAEGLSVRAPRWVALRDVEAALRGKSDWILRKLREARDRQERLEASRIDWRDGVRVLFLGEPVVVRLDPHARCGEAVLEAAAVQGLRRENAGAAAEDELSGTGGAGAPDAGLRTLRLALPHDAGAVRIREATHAWLLQQARCVFVERLDHFAPLLGVRWTRLALSNAATRWGSARSDGSIRLNWRLVQCRLPVLDYVVAHELAHLRVMNHSPRFWATVATVVPGYAALRRELKEEPIPRW